MTQLCVREEWACICDSTDPCASTATWRFVPIDFGGGWKRRHSSTSSASGLVPCAGDAKPGTIWHSERDKIGRMRPSSAFPDGSYSPPVGPSSVLPSRGSRERAGVASCTTCVLFASSIFLSVAIRRQAGCPPVTPSSGQPLTMSHVARPRPVALVGNIGGRGSPGPRSLNPTRALPSTSWDWIPKMLTVPARKSSQQTGDATYIPTYPEPPASPGASPPASTRRTKPATTEGFGEGVAPSFCLRRLFYIDANETHLSGAAAEQPCVSPPPATSVMGPM